jgi:hypothetical protein
LFPHFSILLHIGELVFVFCIAYLSMDAKKASHQKLQLFFEQKNTNQDGKNNCIHMYLIFTMIGFSCLVYSYDISSNIQLISHCTHNWRPIENLILKTVLYNVFCFVFVYYFACALICFVFFILLCFVLCFLLLFFLLDCLFCLSCFLLLFFFWFCLFVFFSLFFLYF